MSGRAIAAFLGLVAACAACGPLLAPQRDASRFFALSVEAEPPASAESAPPADAPVVGVGPISIPEYLDRNEICTRLSETELAYSPTNRWAAPLRESITSVLAEDLGIRLTGSRVLVYPWVGETLDLQIEVRVRHFETTADGKARLVARWTLRDGESGRARLVRESRLSRPVAGDGPGPAVEALSGALADLASEVAQEVRALGSR